MELKIAVCDDDMVDLNIEKEVIEAVFTEKQIDCEYSVYSSPVELLESSIDYDMAFLDIETVCPLRRESWKRIRIVLYFLLRTTPYILTMRLI